MTEKKSNHPLRWMVLALALLLAATAHAVPLREALISDAPKTVPWIPGWLSAPRLAESAAPVPLVGPKVLQEATAFDLLDEEVAPGTMRQLEWFDRQSFPGLEVPAPVLVAHGSRPGPVLCLTAAIHGDELNGIEIVRNLMFGLDPAELNGTVIGVPIVNLHGFRRNSRYLPDRRDLNRYFPGNPNGSSASRIAYSFFESVVRSCEWLVDLHTGSLRRTNLPQLRADLDDERITHLSRGFGGTVVLHSDGAEGTLRGAAAEVGIPAVTIEAGEPHRFQPDEVSHGVRAIRSLLNHLGMDARARLWSEEQPVYYRSTWVRADTGGILTNRVEVGEEVTTDDLLGTITDPITNRRTEIRAPFDGRILGMALNQAMMPGFAAYHIGREADDEGEDEWLLEAEMLLEAGDDSLPDGGADGPEDGAEPRDSESGDIGEDGESGGGPLD